MSRLFSIVILSQRRRISRLMRSFAALRMTFLAMTIALSACSLAPDFKVPEMNPPAVFKEQPAEDVASPGLWKTAMPFENCHRGAWWKMFDDAPLDVLELQAEAANPSLKAASARVEEARALVRSKAASFLPNMDISGNAVRAKPSSASLAAFGGNPNAVLKPYTLYSAQGSASYEADLFGRVRDTEKSFFHNAEAEDATYRSVLLMLQADVAQHYFSLRALDAERKLLRDTIGLRQEAARIMQKRYEAGAAGEQDSSRTQSELASTEAGLLMLDRQRATLEHALAVLLGQMPSDFSIAEVPLEGFPQEIRAGIPSALLERRPDIAAAESAMAAANARIGVARAAFFPNLSLTASGGYESTALEDIFNWSGRTWALGQLAGSALSWNLFDSGRNFGKLDAAKAAYEEAVAQYRQQVLIAFREVEDNLSDQRLLAAQSLKLDSAASAAERTTELTRKRYEEGEVNYFEVIDEQRTSLAANRAAVQTRGQRFLTAIALIRALGGGWGGGDRDAAEDVTEVPEPPQPVFGNDVKN